MTSTAFKIADGFPYEDNYRPHGHALEKETKTEFGTVQAWNPSGKGDAHA